jgi:hypothetical protein
VGGRAKIIFLHHSTGKIVWRGGVSAWFKRYNREHGTRYKIKEMDFPRRSPYGWNNYPYDYWNIWVNHAGRSKYMKEPTLEILTAEYDAIAWKHCFPVSDILEDSGRPRIDSDEKRIENYKLQYAALKEKMREFPGTAFIVWTGAALVKAATSEEKARRAKEFFDWVRDEWDEPGDNIYIWDFYRLETGGGLYLRDEYAKAPANSHPSEELAVRAAPLFCRRVIDVVEGQGDSVSVTGGEMV